jgi:hypothetical protein
MNVEDGAPDYGPALSAKCESGSEEPVC